MIYDIFLLKERKSTRRSTFKTKTKYIYIYYIYTKGMRRRYIFVLFMTKEKEHVCQRLRDFKRLNMKNRQALHNFPFTTYKIINKTKKKL